HMAANQAKTLKWPRKVDDQLKLLSDIRQTESLDESALTLLRRAVSSKTGLVVAQAAKIVALRSLPEFDAMLMEAFERLMDDAAKRDPNCRAKIAIAESLTGRDIDAENIFRHGLSWTQFEPVWGRSVDTAPPLRALCARALVDLRVWDLMARLTDLLADPEHVARLGAVDALTASGRSEALYALRLKARLGDAEPEVTGACFEGVLALDEHEGVSFVQGYIRRHDPVLTDYALLALGQSRRQDALPILIKWVEERAVLESNDAGLSAIVSHRSEAALDYLLSKLADGRPRDAVAIIETLAPMAFDPRIVASVHRATRARSEPELKEVLQSKFPTSGSS
ncbi:MAG: hypothetical protein AAFN74_27275, partial [Myxococcota bacterium]